MSNICGTFIRPNNQQLHIPKCTSLQVINIPTTVTTISCAFAKCYVLQVIDFLDEGEIHSHAFNECPLLRTALEEHGISCMNGRFDELPIHHACYKLNDTIHANDDIIINYFYSAQQDNDPALLQLDIMGMTPLHILCANPAVTKDMIKQLYCIARTLQLQQSKISMICYHGICM